MKNYSAILKLCLFATGLSGIVAEYVLSTLATYFLGDSVFQWTMIVSIMLFSMGLGSRFSKNFEGNLLRKFITLEFILSILVSFVSVLVYTASAYTSFTSVTIYGLSIIVGLLIGMEIPLVIRINESYEVLKVNVSSALENDYYGSLLGGVFFAFIGLPFLGLTYTPFVLGAVNFAVAIVLFFALKEQISRKEKSWLTIAGSIIALAIFSGALMAKDIIQTGEQRRYQDQVIYQHQSQYQNIVITQSGEDYWLFINGNQQLSTLDEVKYHEPLVHPALKLHPDPKNVLILGGGDGCAAREVLKYVKVDSIDLVDLDPAMTKLGNEHFIFTEMNQNSLNHPKVNVINEDAYQFLESTKSFFDVIIIDLPDPKNVELGRLYSFEFYKLCYKKLRPHGIIVTQAGSPYFAAKAFRCIEKTVRAAGFAAIPYHNHILTMGEWGWILGAKNESEIPVKKALMQIDFNDNETKWIDNTAMRMMLTFAKDPFLDPADSIKLNTIHQPVLYKYYTKGRWDLY